MKPTNIVWMVADHFAWHNHRQKLTLPTYDRIAARGVAFERAYSVTPLCQPARSSMLTGQYPHRHRIVLNDGKSGTKAGFGPDDRLISVPLLGAGYRCGYFGKWHCGKDTTAQDFGFEGWSLPGYGVPYRSEIYADYLSERGLPTPKVQIDRDLRNPANEGKVFDLTQHGWGPFASGGRFLTPIDTHESHFVAELAGRWLRQMDGSQPFFLRVDPWGPHHPYHSAGVFAGAIAPERLPEPGNFHRSYDALPLTYEACRRRFNQGPDIRDWSKWQVLMARCHEQAMVVDAALGRIVDTLEELRLLDDTLVIITADHGDLIGGHGNLFNKDSLMVEEVMRIPLALQFPRQAGTGRRSGALVGTLDLPATVMDAAGLTNAGMDGRSLMPFSSEEPAGWRQHLMTQHHGGMRQEYFQRCLIGERFKYVAHLEDYDEFYDLQNDPLELANLAGSEDARAELSLARARLANEMRAADDVTGDAAALLRQMNA